MKGRDALENSGYRRGVVLGLTIAEIILLILFAVVLAMTGVLIKRKNATINEVETRMAAQQMPTDVSKKLSEMGINLASKEGAQRLMGILNQSDRESNSDTDRVRSQQQALQLGLDIQKAFGKNITAEQILKNQIELKNQIDLMKADQNKPGSGPILPPCLQSSKGEPGPFVFDIFVRNDVLLMRDTVPERAKSRFESEFKGIPATQSFNNDRDFINKTRVFAEYGKKHQCKFYVKVFDETTDGKNRLKGQLKLIENSFVWTFMMAGKNSDKEDINLFPVAPTQLK